MAHIKSVVYDTILTKEKLNQLYGQDFMTITLIASKVARLYKPIGFASPLKNYGRTILQEVDKKTKLWCYWSLVLRDDMYFSLLYR